MELTKHVLYNNTTLLDVPLNFMEVDNNLHISGKVGVSLSIDINTGIPKLFLAMFNNSSTYKLYILLDEKPQYLISDTAGGFSNSIDIMFDRIVNQFTITIDDIEPYKVLVSNYPELQMFLHHF